MCNHFCPTYMRAAAYLGALQAQLIVAEEAGEIEQQWPEDSFYGLAEELS